jgi:hypothetical protein
MAPSWCHSGTMDLTPYVDNLRRELAVAADAGGDDARALAERLTAPLESAVRLTLLTALSAAADEITRDLAPGSVDVRLRGLDPSFVVTPSPTDPGFDDIGAIMASPVPSKMNRSLDAEDGTTSRINFRLPEHLKLRIEEAAGAEGLSVNAWLVRTVAATLEPGDQGHRAERHTGRSAQRYTGWAR